MFVTLLKFKLECCSNVPLSVTEELNCYGDLVVPNPNQRTITEHALALLQPKTEHQV